MIPTLTAVPAIAAGLEIRRALEAIRAVSPVFITWKGSTERRKTEGSECTGANDADCFFA